MSNLFSRASTLFVVVGGLGIGACASPSGPSAITSSGKPAQGEQLVQSSARDVASGLTGVSPGVTDTTLVNTGWTCIDAQPQPNSLRTSRLGLSSEAAHSQ